MNREYEELEIEGKRLLATEEFHKLCTHFHLNTNQFHIQHNHYFDTSDFQLKERNAALRVRHKDGSDVLTLKVQSKEGTVEKHQHLEGHEWREGGTLSDVRRGSIQAYVENEWAVSFHRLQHLGTLTTRRAEWEDEGGLFALDESHYLGQVDYELEFEGRSKEHVREVFIQLREQIGLQSTVEPPPKIQRFFTEKQRGNTRTNGFRRE